MDSVTPTATRVTKETKNKIRVDYEGKLSAGQRLKMQLTSSAEQSKQITQRSSEHILQENNIRQHITIQITTALRKTR